ncbi:MAG: DUF309 domain-containing protein [Ignavibacteria bacterium]|nr:DUF309 domain-containing protein [Ignavibacteria bacterium]
MPAPAKKKPEEINPGELTEPSLSEEEWKEYMSGWDLFNRGEFWHAHEAWESVWKRRTEDSRIFFQGIIQLAAALHLLMKADRFDGMIRNFEKAEKKLRLFPEYFLRTNVRALLWSLEQVREEALRLGPDNLRRFDRTLLPGVTLTD